MNFFHCGQPWFANLMVIIGLFFLLWPRFEPGPPGWYSDVLNTTPLQPKCTYAFCGDNGPIIKALNWDRSFCFTSNRNWWMRFFMLMQENLDLFSEKGSIRGHEMTSFHWKWRHLTSPLGDHFWLAVSRFPFTVLWLVGQNPDLNYSDWLKSQCVIWEE